MIIAAESVAVFVSSPLRYVCDPILVTLFCILVIGKENFSCDLEICGVAKESDEFGCITVAETGFGLMLACNFCLRVFLCLGIHEAQVTLLTLRLSRG